MPTLCSQWLYFLSCEKKIIKSAIYPSEWLLCTWYAALEEEEKKKKKEEKKEHSLLPQKGIHVYSPLFVQIYPKYILYIQIYLNISCIKEYRKRASEIIFCTGTFLHLDKVITLLMSQSTYIFWFIPWTHLYGWERAIFEKCLCIIKTLTKLLF